MASQQHVPVACAALTREHEIDAALGFAEDMTHAWRNAAGGAASHVYVVRRMVAAELPLDHIGVRVTFDGDDLYLFVEHLISDIEPG